VGDFSLLTSGHTNKQSKTNSGKLESLEQIAGFPNKSNETSADSSVLLAICIWGSRKKLRKYEGDD
jgi:hypothetical protein